MTFRVSIDTIKRWRSGRGFFLRCSGAGWGKSPDTNINAKCVDNEGCGARCSGQSTGADQRLQVECYSGSDRCQRCDVAG